MSGAAHGGRDSRLTALHAREAFFLTWDTWSRTVYRVTVDMRQHCTDGSFRFCSWRAHTEALSEDSGPEALSTQDQYFALQVFYAILQHIAGELSANCCRTITMTRYRKQIFVAQCWQKAGLIDNFS